IRFMSSGLLCWFVSELERAAAGLKIVCICYRVRRLLLKDCSVTRRRLALVPSLRHAAASAAPAKRGNARGELGRLAHAAGPENRSPLYSPCRAFSRRRGLAVRLL